MKKTLITILFAVLCICTYAQKSSLVFDLNYRSKIDDAKYGIGANYRYSLPYNIRLAANVTAYIPSDSNLGLDISINGHYLVNIIDNFRLYPVIGVVASNHSFSAVPNNRNITDLGCNLGLGAEFDLSDRGFLNFEFNQLLLKKEKPEWYSNYAIFSIGYGIRF